MEDKNIIKLLWLRSESAIEALSKRFGKRLMWIAMNILGTPQDAEESVNDTYLAVWNTVPPKKPDPLCSPSPIGRSQCSSVPSITLKNL
jgi:RNA polymerase sigma-70 factor (ECF subfamily)